MSLLQECHIAFGYTFTAMQCVYHMYDIAISGVSLPCRSVTIPVSN